MQDIPVEQWKDIVGFEGYEISSWGRVYSHKSQRFLVQVINSWGYAEVRLYDLRGRQHSKRVNRLVAEAFIQNPDGHPIVNHIDECKTNNHVENLEWCTQKHNMNAGTVKKRISDTESIPVIQYDMDMNVVKVWKGISTAGAYYHSHHISECCKGKRKTVAGYIWRYENGSD